MTEAKQLPHSESAERAVLGALIVAPHLYHQVATIIRPADFYSPRHRMIWEAMGAAEAAGEPIDPVLLEARLQASGDLQRSGGMAYLLEISDAVIVSDRAPAHARKVRELAAQRAIIEAATGIAAEGYGDVDDVGEYLARAEQAIFTVGEQARGFSRRPLRASLQDFVKRVEDRGKNPNRARGVPTGLADLDAMLAGRGLQAGNLALLAARPSMGKTALALQVAHHAAIRARVPTIVFSLEMTTDECVERLGANAAEVSHDHLGTGQMDAAEWKALVGAVADLDGAPLEIDDKPGATAAYVASVARSFFAKHRPDDDDETKAGERPRGLVVVDYIGLMTPDAGGRSDTRDRELGRLSQALKGTAKDLGVPILVLAQLNRGVEKREDKRPMMADLRDSGNLEQDADLVLALYRDDYYLKAGSKRPGVAEIILLKQRNGATGDVLAWWDASCGRFKSMTRDDQERFRRQGADAKPKGNGAAKGDDIPEDEMARRMGL